LLANTMTEKKGNGHQSKQAKPKMTSAGSTRMSKTLKVGKRSRKESRRSIVQGREKGDGTKKMFRRLRSINPL